MAGGRSSADAVAAFGRNGAGPVLPGLMLAGPAGTEVGPSLRYRPNVLLIMLTAKDTGAGGGAARAWRR